MGFGVYRSRGKGKLRCRKLKTLPGGIRRFSLLIAGNTTQEAAPQNEKKKYKNWHRKKKGARGEK